MSDSKLQKVILPPDVLDLSFGEPVVVAEAMYKELRESKSFTMPTQADILKWTYQPAAGNPEYVALLEKKYNAKVVVCNGGKQALAAALYAFKQAGHDTIHYDSPYYPANPYIVNASSMSLAPYDTALSALITSPNNPDGNNHTNYELLRLSQQKPTIHDAAYYSPIYLPDNQKQMPIGDIQVFSLSKMYGVSGLRIGYAVCHNPIYYNDMVNFIETATAGVSSASQDIAMKIEKFFIECPWHLRNFHENAMFALMQSRLAIKNLDLQVIEILPSDSNSMFAWGIAGPKLDYKAAKVHLLDGELFGKPGMVRLNIAQPLEIINEAVYRLNNSKKK